MSTSTPLPPPSGATVAPSRPPGFAAVLRAEWIKLTSVRSTWWTLGAMVVLGAGLTIVICALNAEWLASEEADDPAGAFITWGMLVAQVTAVVLGALVVTSEYGTGMIRSTFAAVPARGRVLAAKTIVLALFLFVAGTGTALLGYAGANPFLAAEGVGMSLEGDVLRAMYGNGLFMAGLGVFTAAVGFLVRHTAGVISIVLALMLVVGNMALLIPGEVGEWVVKLVPGNAGAPIATPVPFNPNLLDAWPGFGVFVAETLALVLLAWVLLRRRDA